MLERVIFFYSFFFNSFLYLLFFVVTSNNVFFFFFLPLHCQTLFLSFPFSLLVKVNDTLESLDLSHNNLNARSVSVLANALIYNVTLGDLNVDGCILGNVGTQAFVGAIQRAAGSGRKLDISFDGCDCDVHDSKVFNPANPTGVWELDLSTPYGLMVTEECFFLTNNKVGCNLVSLYYQGTKGSNKKVDLIHKVDGGSSFDEDGFRKSSKALGVTVSSEDLENAAREIIPILAMFKFKITNTLAKKIISRIDENWKELLKQGVYHEEDFGDVLMFQLFVALFQIADEDESGFVSYEELRGIFKLLNVVVTDEAEMNRLEKAFDYDGTGQVDMDEFTNAMVAEFCIMAKPKGALVEKSTGAPWQIPPDGTATIEMLYQIEKPGVFNVMRNGMMFATLEQLRTLKSRDQRMTVFKHVVTSPYYFMNAGQAQILLDEMSNNTDGALDLVVEILPQIVDEINIIRFLDGNLTAIGKLALRIKIGNLYNAYVGNPTGHYFFDLKVRMQRIAAKKLSTISVSEANYCESKNINTSQRGIYSSFRNETLTRGSEDTVPIKATGEWFSELPYSGR